MKFPGVLSTERVHIMLHRVTRENAGAYILALQANRDRLRDSYVPDAKPSKSKVRAHRDVMRDLIEGLLDDKTLDMGIWKMQQFVGAVSLTPNETGETAEVGCWIDRGEQGMGYASCALRAIAAYGSQEYSQVITRVRPPI